MPQQKAHEVLRKHDIDVKDVMERKTSLHHLRHVVKTENQGFDVFRELVKLRR